MPEVKKYKVVGVSELKELIPEIEFDTHRPVDPKSLEELANLIAEHAPKYGFSFVQFVANGKGTLIMLQRE